MRHPTRDLRAFVDDELDTGRRAAVARHLDRCPSCRGEVAEERRLRSRLRAMAPPPPAPGLEDRIAVSAAAAARRPPARPATARGALAVAAGLGLAGVVVIAGTYVVGSNLGGVAEGQRASLAAGWEAASTTEELDDASLDRLRDSGWTCPELESLGLELVSARAVQIAGEPAIELQLAGEDEQIIVYEQRPGAGGQARQAAPSAVNALTGRPAGEDGFVPDPDSVGAQLWEHPDDPGVAVLASSSVTYTLESSLPVRSLPEAIDELALTESARLVPASAPDTDLLDRIVRGLSDFTMPGPPW